MKKVLLLATVMAFFGLRSQAQYWCWVKDSTITGEAGASQAAATDLYGNIYGFSASKHLLKHNTNDGSIEWTKNNVGSTDFRRSYLATDVVGNVFLAYDSTGLINRITKIDSFG